VVREIRLGLNLGQRQELRLLQTPQMIQAMQLLQKPLMELKDQIELELQENVFLELKEEQAETGKETPAPAESLDREVDSLYETLDELEKRSSDFQPRSPAAKGSQDEDGKYEALQNTPVSGITLPDHLLEQLAILDLSPPFRNLVEQVIWNLDDNGRLLVTPEELVELGKGDYTLEEAQKAIALVQTLDPPGVAARDLKDCLLIQLDLLQGGNSFLRRLVENHLDDLMQNRIPAIARAMDCQVEDVKQGMDLLRQLTPHPGAEFGRDPYVAITPDVIVTEEDGEFRISVERESIPPLRISSAYRNLLKTARSDRKTVEYLRKKLEKAKSFIDAIGQRESSIKRVCQEVVERQKEFFRQGPSQLRPMRMQEVADALGIHISTVSRAISGKYMQTENGLFELRRFFTSGMATEDGEEKSQQTIKQWLKDLVDQEDKSRPLSDDALVKELGDRKNVKLARRTVTKYRKALGIPSSRLRKSY
jgi:RNA polymerase sigma-54 factor